MIPRVQMLQAVGNLKPWGRLSDGFKKANYEQAAHSVQILQAAGFGVRPKKEPVVFDPDDSSDVEVEFMARMEHGRWNVERLQKGWRYGPRDGAKKLHDCLAPWSRLSDGSDGVRKYDRGAVRAFPEILAKAGLEVYRLSPSGRKLSRRPRRKAK